jgi:hypothetical protein
MRQALNDPRAGHGEHQRHRGKNQKQNERQDLSFRQAAMRALRSNASEGKASGKKACSFLKKRTKKLLHVAPRSRPTQGSTALPETEQKFFGSFFQKRTAFPTQRRG